jgi:hypothetical protein
MLVCTNKKKLDQTYNKFMDGVKFIVKIILSDDLIIGVGR